MLEFILDKMFYREESSTNAIFMNFEVDNAQLYADLPNLFAPFQIGVIGLAKGDPPEAPFVLRFETTDIRQTQFHIMRYMVSRVEHSIKLGHALIDYRIIGGDCAPPTGTLKEQQTEKQTYYEHTFLKQPDVHRFVQEAERKRLKAKAQE